MVVAKVVVLVVVVGGHIYNVDTFSQARGPLMGDFMKAQMDFMILNPDCNKEQVQQSRSLPHLPQKPHPDPASTHKNANIHTVVNTNDAPTLLRWLRISTRYLAPWRPSSKLSRN